MAQELGETVNEIIKDDERDIQAILNRRGNDHYWIVIHHKPTKQRLSTGELIIRKVIKDYDMKPRPLIGTIVLEVKDSRIISETVNVPDAPIDWWQLEGKIGSSVNPHVQKRPDIARDYLYNV
jgi:hypothetical protein